MKITLGLIFACFLLTGCLELPPTPPAIPPEIVGSENDHGLCPTNADELVHTYIKVFFKDPNSIQDLVIQKPMKFFLTTHTDFGDVYFELHKLPKNSQVYCYEIGFSVNAKNSYGGYVGSQYYHMFVRNGEIIDCMTF